MLRSPLSSPLRSPLSSPLAARRGGGAQTITDLLSTQRVDFVGIGDSNWGLSGHGWDDGLQFGLSNRWPMYGTGLLCVNENRGSGSLTGYKYARSLTTTFAWSGAADFDARLRDGDLTPHNYTYLASGTNTVTTKGIALDADCPLSVDAALQFTTWTGGFDTGSGQFSHFVRRSNSPFTPVFTGSAISTNTGNLGEIVKTTSQISAASRGYPIQFLLGQGSTVPLTGPFWLSYGTITNPASGNGFRMSKFRSLGGESIRQSAAALKAASDDTLIHYFECLRDAQAFQARKSFVFMICHGLNGRVSDALIPSEGPLAHLPGNDGTAFVDNFDAIRLRVEGIWSAQGWDLSELRWIVFVSHPISNPDDALLTEYRAAMLARAGGNVSVIDLSALTDEAEMLANGWYASGGSDRSHLTEAGYLALGDRIIGAIA